MLSRNKVSLEGASMKTIVRISLGGLPPNSSKPGSGWD
jgi:hypothetical protein